MMPEMDGLELLQCCRQDRGTAEIPFLVLSARASEQTLLEALRGGADDYLAKPFGREELTVRASRLVRFRELDAENQSYRDEIATRQQLRRFQQSLPELQEDLEALDRILYLDPPSTLNKIRYITEKVLHLRAVSQGVSWGNHEPTLERLIGPLRAGQHIPGNIAIHVRTIQNNTSPGSHFQASPLSRSHAHIATQALVGLMEWCTTLG